MSPRRLLLAAPVLLLAAPLPAAAQEQQAGDLTLSQPWSRAAGAGGTGAGYLTIRNRGGAADRLVGGSTPAARNVELHTHVRDGEVMRMREVPAIEIPAGGTVALEPGGYHLMLVGLASPLRQGATVPVTLRFERAGEVRVNLSILAAGARGPAAAHGQGHGH
jgi:hypothetical protein